MDSQEHSEQIAVALAKQRLREWASTPSQSGGLPVHGAMLFAGALGAGWLAKRALSASTSKRSMSLPRLVTAALAEQALRWLLPLVWHKGLERITESKP